MRPWIHRPGNTENRISLLFFSFRNPARLRLRWSLHLSLWIGVIGAIALLLPGSGQAPWHAESEWNQRDPKRFPVIHRVLCVNRPEGCPCRNRPQRGSGVVTGLNHFLPVYNARKKELSESNTWFEVDTGDGTCWVPEHRLEQMEYTPILESPLQKRNHQPIALQDFIAPLPAGNPEEKGVSAYLNELLGLHGEPLGKFWPTFYHLALEDFHPGEKVPAKNPGGRVVAHVSREFLKQVRWEGSGLMSDGTKIRYAGVPGRFRTYDDAKWGYGAGYGYTVHPYRTLAVNFAGICDKLSHKFGRRCGKREIIGMMVFIPEIARRKIIMPGGAAHDGYFCLTDTGSPHYIKYDRIDMFVGVHGGGNPYLPPERRSNYFTRGGIDSIKPYHWKLWKKYRDRYWCPRSKLPENPENPEPGSCTLDYHTTAHELGMEMIAIFQKDGSPLRCRKKPAQ